MKFPLEQVFSRKIQHLIPKLKSKVLIEDKQKFSFSS